MALMILGSHARFVPVRLSRGGLLGEFVSAKLCGKLGEAPEDRPAKEKVDGPAPAVVVVVVL